MNSRLSLGISELLSSGCLFIGEHSLDWLWLQDAGGVMTVVEGQEALAVLVEMLHQ